MSTRYYDLLDVRVEVDSTGLKEKLDELEASTWTEDTINDLIEQKLSNDSYVTDGDARDIFREMAHDEGEAMVEGLIDNRDFVANGDVDDLIASYIRNESFVTEDDLSGKVDEAIEATGLENQVGTLANELKTLTEDFNVQVKALEDKLAAVIEGHNIVAQRVAALEERDDTAMDFFKLIKQAFALLKQ